MARKNWDNKRKKPYSRETILKKELIFSDFFIPSHRFQLLLGLPDVLYNLSSRFGVSVQWNVSDTGLAGDDWGSLYKMPPKSSAKSPVFGGEATLFQPSLPSHWEQVQQPWGGLFYLTVTISDQGNRRCIDWPVNREQLPENQLLLHQHSTRTVTLLLQTSSVYQSLTHFFYYIKITSYGT